MKRLITSESVSSGHPDKIADQISDSIVDQYLLGDPNSKVAVETMVKDNCVILGGEVKSNSIIDLDKTIREVVKDIGYDDENSGFYYKNLTIINLIGKQSQEINSAVEKEETAAGDQGFVIGYATNETPNMMPLGMHISKKLINLIKDIDGLGPDAKSQVTIEEEDGSKRVHTILISTQHTTEINLDDLRYKLKSSIRENTMGLDKKIFNLIDEDTQIFINPAGTWNIGGPVSDCGLTGRKIVVDQYGPYCPVGGGAFSGKDADSKVDRSGAYLARYIAKNIVSSGVTDKCKVEISYIIGKTEPTSLNIDTFGKYDDGKLIRIIKEIIDMRPDSISERFNLKSPKGWNYLESSKGHYGNIDFPWEKLDLNLKKYIN